MCTCGVLPVLIYLGSTGTPANGTGNIQRFTLYQLLLYRLQNLSFMDLFHNSNYKMARNIMVNWPPSTVGASSGKGKNDKEANCTKKTQHCATKLSLNQLYKLTSHTSKSKPCRSSLRHLALYISLTGLWWSFVSNPSVIPFEPFGWNGRTICRGGS